MTPLKFFEKGASAVSHNSLNFRALHANTNSSKMDKVMDFKFGMHVPGDSPDMTP